MQRIALTVLCLILVAAPASTATAGPASTQSAPVFALHDFSVAGDASLLRNDNAVTARIDVSGAEPGVYTLWWMVFNNPTACATTPCTLDDVANPATGFAIGYGGGTKARSDGRLHLATSLRERAELAGFPTAEFGIADIADTALRDARRAEVWAVLRTHGPELPDLMAEQLRTFNGGCVYTEPFQDSAPAYGQPGPNVCADSNVAIFTGA